MTDGIIQEVFSKHIQQHIQHERYQRGWDIWITQEVIELKQELIEKIRVYIDAVTSKDLTTNNNLKKALIGDSQE